MGLAACGGAMGGAEPDADEARHEFSETHMGTTFRIVVYGEDPRIGPAVEEAFARVRRLDSLFSDYRTDSEIARLVAAGAGSTPVSAELSEVLAVALRWSERTDGAFDVTVGPLTRLWRWSARRGELPDQERIDSARAAVGWQRVTMDPERSVVRLGGPDMALDLGGIAKGYAADAALAVLREAGFPAALVDAGGDVVAGEPPPGTSGWRVGLVNGGSVELSQAAIATSGDLHGWFEVDGRRYSHIVDPRTGVGVLGPHSVTVVADDATTADVLASALSVMERDSAMRLLLDLDGVAARVTGIEEWEGGRRPWPRTLTEEVDQR